jgi:hypothetical protein
LEGAGLDHVASHFEEGLVDALDHIGPGQDEVIVAPLERRASEVFGGQVKALDVGAHGAIVDEDAAGECVEVSMVNREKVELASHGTTSGVNEMPGI